jgi:hypothetical protein
MLQFFFGILLMLLLGFIIEGQWPGIGSRINARAWKIIATAGKGQQTTTEVKPEPERGEVKPLTFDYAEDKPEPNHVHVQPSHRAVKK